MTNIQQEKVAKMERKLAAVIAAHKTIKAKLMTSKEKAIEEKSLAVTEAKLQALIEYKASKVFEVEIAKGSTFIFTIDFDLYKARVADFSQESM
ncbi:hypothetical protein COCNU_09G003180 [Cocos nucifera]|uniref:Uncharacterized protein n=1 Tax=Cocos nucifera TaxID=13894 RepID=A0A8K0N721_COCNU|nr:hypothetical protein COCNU_09G003180 [Cocos nucifera]